MVSETEATWRATSGEALTVRARARMEMIEKRILVVGFGEVIGLRFEKMF